MFIIIIIIIHISKLQILKAREVYNPAYYLTEDKQENVLTGSGIHELKAHVLKTMRLIVT